MVDWSEASKSLTEDRRCTNFIPILLDEGIRTTDTPKNRNTDETRKYLHLPQKEDEEPTIPLSYFNDLSLFMEVRENIQKDEERSRRKINNWKGQTNVHLLLLTLFVVLGLVGVLACRHTDEQYTQTHRKSMEEGSSTRRDGMIDNASVNTRTL